MLLSITNGWEVGVVSVALQFGPRDPMNDVFPTRVLFKTVKSDADDIAMPYPKAPVKVLFCTVPPNVTFVP